MQKFAYEDHHWLIYVNLKMVNFSLRQQARYTKHPCFYCLWESRFRDEHWIRKDCPVRNTLTSGKSNIINQPLVSKNIFLQPPHIKLGLMKQFVKTMNKDGDCIKHICRKFLGLSYEKLNQGIFNGPEIRQLIKDLEFTNSMTKYISPENLLFWLLRIFFFEF